MSGFLPLSAGSMLAHRLLLDLKLGEEGVLLLLIDSLIIETHFIIFVIVELSNSPIWCIIILLLPLRRHWVSATESLRIHNLVGNALRLHRMLILVLRRRNQTRSERVHLRLDLLLSLGSLLLSQLLVHVLIDSLRTGLVAVGAACHLLAHHLLERTVLLEFQDSLWLVLLLGLLLLLLPEFIDVGFGQNACFMRLPLDVVKLLEGFLLHKNLRAIRTENLEPIIDLQSFVQHRVQKVAPAGRPLDLDGTWEFCLADFFLCFEVPKVHFTFRNISKATNHENRAEWADLDRVPELLSEFKGGLTVQIVHGCHGWLLPGDNDELLSILCPLHILDLVIENRNEFPIFSLVDTNVLKRVLPIVTFARRVVLVLGPDKNGVSGWRRNNLDVVGSRARNVELWPLQIAIQVIHVDKAVVLGV